VVIVDTNGTYHVVVILISVCGGGVWMCVCVHICQQCTFIECTSQLTYIIIIVPICYCNLIKIRWFFVFALFSFVYFWFVCLLVVLALHHHLTTFRTALKTADLSFMLDRPFTFKKVKYIDQFNNITSHVFDFTSSRIGKLVVSDWFVVNIKIYTLRFYINKNQIEG